MSLEGWAERTLGQLFSSRRAHGRPGMPVISVTMSGLAERRSLDRRVESDLTPRQHLLVEKGDLVYNTMRMWQGVSGVAEFDCLVSPAYVVCSPNGSILPQYSAHLCKSAVLIAKFKAYSQGVAADRFRLYFHHFQPIPVTIPPLPEQRRIAEILDTIDEAIRKTEQVIAKLKQMKQGLLHDLLTRGIDENGELRDTERHPEQFKDSPLGTIPKEWEFSDLGRYLATTPQNGLYKPATFYGDSGVPIVRIDALNDGVLAPTESLKRLKITTAEAQTYSLNPGNLLVNRVNSIDFVGKSALVPLLSEPVVFESNMMRLSLDEARLSPQYAIRWLCFTQCRHFFLRRAKHAIAQTSINQADVRDAPCLVPSPLEQQEIVSRVSALEHRTLGEEKEFEKLKALKLGLLHDLLSGRVRVPLVAVGIGP